MSIRRCVNANRTTSAAPRLKETASRGAVFFFVLAALYARPFPAVASSADEPVSAATSTVPASAFGGAVDVAANFPPFPRATTQIVVSISVNNASMGDFFVDLDGQGRLFMKVEDLVNLKLRILKDRTVLIRSEPYAPLSALPDVKYTFDEKNLTVSILGKTTEQQFTAIDVYPLRARPHNAYYPHETSAFLNYGLSYAYSDPLGFQSLSATSKLGFRSGDVFFTSDSLYTKTETAEQFVRLQSSATYERRSDRQWLVFGDQYASSGDLGGTANIGGIGFSKVFRIDPYFITQPVFSLKGATVYPSQADIYLDGNLVGRKQIAPGIFELNSIYSYAGSHNVEVVLRDPFGNEQKISYPLYFGTQLLREGVHEYSYHAGFLRKQYGIESNDYGKPAFSAFHRYGVTSAFNIGARAEGADGVYDGGFSTAFALPHIGAFIFSAAGSSANGVKGTAASLQHSYQSGSFSTNLLFREFSRNYATISAPTATDSTRYELSLGAGYSVPKWGGISLGYSESETYGGLSSRITSASYSKGLTPAASLFVTASATRTADTTSYSFFVGLNFNLDRDHHASAQYNKTGSTGTETLQIQKNQPLGEGLGYQASLMKSDNGQAASYSFNPGFQYNARYGTYSANSSFQSSSRGSSKSYLLSAAGAFVYAGGLYGMSRPVSDSFAFVTVGSVPGADVLSNGSEIGKTDSSGMLVVPTLASYVDNQITVDTKNIPMEYTVSGVNTKISPSLWSGSCVAFDAFKVRAVTGSLAAKMPGKKIPMEYADISLKIGERELTFPTGKGGEFYIENSLPEETKPNKADKLSCRAIAERRKSGGNVIQPGTYQASVDYNGSKCRFSVAFPTTDDPITDLGELECAVQGTPAPVRKAEPVPDANPVTLQKQASPSKPAAKRYTFVVRPVFDRNGAPVREKDRKAFARIADMLKEDPDLGVEIEVHGDRHGTDAASRRIGLKKANAIRKYLIRSGVSAGRIAKVESLGNKKLICREPTTACDRINRRGVIRIVPEDAAPGLLSMQARSSAVGKDVRT